MQLKPNTSSIRFRVEDQDKIAASDSDDSDDGGYPEVLGDGAVEDDDDEDDDDDEIFNHLRSRAFPHSFWNEQAEVIQPAEGPTDEPAEGPTDERPAEGPTDERPAGGPADEPESDEFGHSMEVACGQISHTNYEAGPVILLVGETSTGKTKTIGFHGNFRQLGEDGFFLEESKYRDSPVSLDIPNVIILKNDY